MKIPFSFNPLGVSNDSGGGMPTSGLVFYWDMTDKAATTANTGQSKTFVGSIDSFLTNETKDGIECIHCMNSSTNYYVNFESPGIPAGSAARTISIWANFNVQSSSSSGLGDWLLLKYGEISPSIYKWWVMTPYQVDTAYVAYSFTLSTTIETGTWHNYTITFENGTLSMFVDGVLESQVTNCTINSVSTNLRLFGAAWGTDKLTDGWLSSLRIYDRVLTDDEVTTLANEFTPHYQITASDLTFSLYQKNETYGISYSSPGGTPTFEIIEGELPSTISFNTSTGQFSGKGLTDADHTYNLKVRLTAPNSTPATCNVTIYTYKTARIYLYDQSFSFISNKAESKSISYTSDESVTFTIESGTLPAGMTMTTGGYFSSSGTNTSAETQQVVVRATSANNQTGVTATMTLDMQMNAVVLNAQTLKFYTAQGVKTKAVKYSGSLNTISDAVFSMTGTLPAGVTWDATTGSFTSDGTQSADEIASVSVTVSSSNGSSTAATAAVTIEAHVGEAPMPTEDLLVHIPCDSYSSATEEGLTIEYYNADSSNFTTHKGIKCFDTSAANRRMLVQDFDVNFNNQYTESIWICQSALAHTFSRGLCFGYDQSRQSLVIPNIYPDTLRLGAGGHSVDLSTNYYISLDTWYHIVQTFDNGICKIFVNGELVYTSYTTSINVRQAMMSVGISTHSTLGDYFKGYLAGARVYNRVLSDEEIALLATEFTPTP